MIFDPETLDGQNSLTLGILVTLDILGILIFQNQPDGAMIGTENIVVNECLFDPAFFNNILGHEKVINAPPDIAIPGFKPVGPPRVFYGIRKKMPERVQIAVLDDPIQPVPLDS